MYKSAITTTHDFPKDGIVFKDILPIFLNPDHVTALIDDMADLCKAHDPDYIYGLDARGFLLGPMIAVKLGLPFVPIRKQGKLPGRVVSCASTKEYGADVLETYEMDLTGKRVVLIDDVLATGGTMKAATHLIEQCHGTVCGCVVVINTGLESASAVKSLY